MTKEISGRASAPARKAHREPLRRRPAAAVSASAVHSRGGSQGPKSMKKEDGAGDKLKKSSSDIGAGSSSDFIEGLFSSVNSSKKKNAEAPKAVAPSEAVAAGEKKKKDKASVVATSAAPPSSSRQHGIIASASKKPKIISPDPPVERIDAESGLKVYKAHLLKVGEGGGTPLCPFDCDCCF